MFLWFFLRRMWSFFFFFFSSRRRHTRSKRDWSSDVCSSDLIAARLRRGEVPVLLVANKVDGPGLEPQIGGFWSLGLGEPLPVSSLHGRGSGDVLDAIVERLGPERRQAPDDDHPAVAIVGRPNVGKSSLLNRMAGAELAIVDPTPGTTRDTVDSVVEHGGRGYRVVDTAGMRRSFQQAEGADYFALVRSFQAVDRADVALLVLDAPAGVTDQDQKVAWRAPEWYSSPTSGT